MEFSIVEKLSGLQESIFSLSRGPQIHFGEKYRKLSNFIKFIDFPLFPLVWGPLGCCHLNTLNLLQHGVATFSTREFHSEDGFDHLRHAPDTLL